MMNILFIDFHAATGEIIRWGAWYVEDLAKLPETAANCQRVVFEVEPGEAYDLSNCYIDLNANPVKLKNLKSLNAPDVISLKIGETTEITGLPGDTTVELDGETYDVTDGALTLEGEMEAAYVITLKAPTYKTHSLEVVVQNVA